MAENPSGPTEPLDVQRIHYLVRLMKRYDLTALDLIDGSVQIRLRRRGPEPAAAAGRDPAGRRGLPGRRQPAAAPRTEPSRRQRPLRRAAKTVVIESPMVGTYYASQRTRRSRRSSRSAPWSTPTRSSASSRR